MQGQGLLVVNEIDGERVKVLTQNLERCGVPAAPSKRGGPFRRRAGEQRSGGHQAKPGKHPSVHGAAHSIFRDFVRKTFINPNHFPGPFTLFGEHLYQVPEEFPSNKVSGRLLKNHYPKWAALGPVLRRPL
jgi:hypothetical protein